MYAGSCMRMRARSVPARMRTDDLARRLALGFTPLNRVVDFSRETSAWFQKLRRNMLGSFVDEDFQHTIIRLSVVLPSKLLAYFEAEVFHNMYTSFSAVLE